MLFAMKSFFFKICPMTQLQILAIKLLNKNLCNFSNENLTECNAIETFLQQYDYDDNSKPLESN